MKESRQLGDYLVVGLNTDKAVKELKGSDRPIEAYADRKKNLLATGYVDEVVPIGKLPIDGILKHKPDIITKGDDYKEEEVVGYGVAKVHIIRRLSDQSTTRKIQARKTR